MSNLLSLKNICKMFNKGTVDETTLFDGFNLDIQEGDFVSIVGSNGSGKTTILNIISGSTPIDGGDVLLRNENINKMKEYERARKIARVYQDPALGTSPNLTVLENLALADNKGRFYGLSFALNKKKKVEYQELLKSLGMGLEEKMNTKVKKLSGGQRQALALLMATLRPVDILLLDEHTAALDPKTSEEIMKLTNRIIKDKKITTLMVTHNLRYAVEYGNRILMFNEGKIIIDKSNEEKDKTSVDDLLKTFNEISIECGN